MFITKNVHTCVAHGFESHEAKGCAKFELSSLSFRELINILKCSFIVAKTEYGSKTNNKKTKLNFFRLV